LLAVLDEATRAQVLGMLRDTAQTHEIAAVREACTAAAEVRIVPLDLPASETAIPKGMTLHRVGAGTPDQAGWYFAKSTKGKFSVKVPVPFNDYTMEVTAEDGRRLGGHGIGGKSLDGITFSITELREGSVIEERTLKGFPATYRSKGASVTDERYFKYAGFPAVEFVTTAPGSICHVRQIVLPDRVYLVMVEYPPLVSAKASALVETCFDSLEIAEPEQPSPKEGARE
jgi:hypothetical protein